MRIGILLPLALLVSVSACKSAGDAEETADLPVASIAEDASAKPEPIILVRGSLRGVATAQERYWGEHQTYTTDLEVLKETPGFKIEDQVTVRIVEVSETGWAMEATHPEFVDRSFVQWYGKPGAVRSIATALEGKRGDESPGRVVCDTPEGT